MFEKTWLPQALAIGVSYDEFWSMNPHIINLLMEGHKLKMRMEDEQMWMFGIYIQSAVSVAIEKNLAGKKAKQKYIDKPIMQEVCEDDGLTQEEIDEREINKMILAEEQWIASARMKGLPETVIN